MSTEPFRPSRNETGTKRTALVRLDAIVPESHVITRTTRKTFKQLSAFVSAEIELYRKQATSNAIIRALRPNDSDEIQTERIRQLLRSGNKSCESAAKIHSSRNVYIYIIYIIHIKCIIRAFKYVRTNGRLNKLNVPRE